ncbi:hypothetical protein [Microbispora sp. ATCC PTA-5024]|uniref:hypothetical protein n=1 Tax=Microbispora sp. ATCC PTA-5024 TaxID=316330 RepID=UPI0003DC5C6D|nr:hypothetical protein [Microbispora sp. ATCC PTA-5024]ETK31099.1 hypothetical protein MPTA5024_36860 [Microbispora sp. ATCC PTA-5024]
MTGGGAGAAWRTALLRTRLRAAVAALLVVATAACGVEPTGVVDMGPAPVITGTPALVRIYLVRNGRLEPITVAARSPHVNDIMAALFKARARPGSGLTTALAGLTPAQIQLVRYAPDAGSRNDPDNTLSLRMRLFVSGWRVSRLAMAQVTCTARLRPEVWAVEIAQSTPDRTGSLKIHTCREYWDLAPKDGHLPP